MAKYTDEQLKDMAQETIKAHNLGDHRADVLIQIMSQVTNTHPAMVIQKLNQMCDKVI
jgi:hypothetical protein